MQKKIQELETHIDLLVSEISLLKAEIKSKSSVAHAETLANEAKSLAVTAEAGARSAMNAIENLEFKEVTHRETIGHEYDKGDDFFVGTYQERSPDKFVSAVYSNDSGTSVTIMADKITLEENGGK